MVNKLMYIPKEDTQNYPFCRLQLGVKTFEQNQYKFLKLLSQRIRKRYYKTLGTIVITIPMSPPCLAELIDFGVNFANFKTNLLRTNNNNNIS